MMKSKIPQIIEKEGLTSYGFSKAINVKPDRAAALSEGAIPSIENVSRICGAFDLRVEDVIFFVQAREALKTE